MPRLRSVRQGPGRTTPHRFTLILTFSPQGRRDTPSGTGLRGSCLRRAKARARGGWFDRLTMSGHKHTSPWGLPTQPRDASTTLGTTRPRPALLSTGSPSSQPSPLKGEGSDTHPHSTPCALRCLRMRAAQPRGWIPACTGMMGGRPVGLRGTCLHRRVRRAHHERAPTHSRDFSAPLGMTTSRMPRPGRSPPLPRALTLTLSLRRGDQTPTLTPPRVRSAVCACARPSRAAGFPPARE